MSRLGRMYTQENRFDNDDEFIVVEELQNTVALMHTNTNSIYWVTKHVLDLNKLYQKKLPTEANGEK